MIYLYREVRMQNSSFRRDAAALWHWVANVNSNTQFSDLVEQSTDTLLHPGFVGSSYPVDGSGTLVIGMNPGGGTDTVNLEERETLVNIRREGSVRAFDHLNHVAKELFLSWHLWKNNLLPLLNSKNIDPYSIAYIHAVPFRVKDNIYLSKLYYDAWKRVSSKQATLLNPGRILLAGKTAGEKLYSHMPVKSKIITRSIGDKVYADNSAKIAASHDQAKSDLDFWE